MNRMPLSSMPTLRRPALSLFAAVLLATCVAGAANAATITWTNAAGGAWSNAANWSPAVVPGSSDDAVLPALSGAYTVSLDVNPSAASLVIAAGDPTLDMNGQSIGSVGSIANSGTIANFAGTYDGSQIANQTGGRIVSAYGGRITAAGSFINDGTIEISGPGSELYTNGNLTASGSGTLLLAGGSIVDASGTVTEGLYLTLTSGQTLTGVGLVAKKTKNYGTILAATNGEELRLKQGATITNHGTIRIENDASLRSEGAPFFSHGGLITTGPGGGTLDMENVEMDGSPMGKYGTIDISGGGAIELNGGDLKLSCEGLWGGPVRAVGDGGSLTVDFGSIQQLSIEANTDVYDIGHVDFIHYGEHVRIDGHLHVSGSMACGATGDTLTVEGAGSIELDGGTLGNGDSLSGTLLCAAGFTIHGHGTINPPFVNEGTVDLDGVLRVPDVPRAWRNYGLIRVGRNPLVITGANARLQNLGRIETTRIEGPIQVVKGGTLDNRGGVVTASGGSVQLGNLDTYGNLTGGRFETANGAEIVVTRGGTLRDVTVGTTAVLHVMPNATAVLAGSLTNLGTVRVSGTGRIAGDVTGVYVQKGGVTALEGGSLVSARDVLLQAGTLRGFGTISANLRNGGMVSPDAGVTALRVAGNYTQVAGGSLQLSIAGAAAEQRSHFQVDGAATLAGGLDAQLTGGYVPAAGSRFGVFTYGSMTGAFDAASAAAAGGNAPLVPVFEAGGMTLVSNGTTAVGDPAAPVRTLRFSSRVTSFGTVFALELPYAAEVKGRIYDAAGREVAKLTEGAMPAGVHLFEVNRAGGVQGLSSGVYFARMSVIANGNEEVRTTRAIVLR